MSRLRRRTNNSGVSDLGGRAWFRPLSFIFCILAAGCHGSSSPTEGGQAGLSGTYDFVADQHLGGGSSTISGTVQVSQSGQRITFNVCESDCPGVIGMISGRSIDFQWFGGPLNCDSHLAGAGKVNNSTISGSVSGELSVPGIADCQGHESIDFVLTRR